MSLRFGVDEATASKLVAALNNSAKDLRKNVAIAVKATAKATSRHMAKQISSEIMLTIKTAQQGINIKYGDLSAEVTLDDSDRIPLRDFGARETLDGVSYKIGRKDKRKTIKSAFLVDKFGNRVFRRVRSPRLPIIQLLGPSLVGVLSRDDRPKVSAEFAQTELKKQILRRVHFAEFKKGKK